MSPSLDYEAVLAQAAGAVDDMVGLTHDMRKITGGIVDGRGHDRPAVTNRALYDQFIGTMGRANGMLARFENPHGSLAMLLNDPDALQPVRRGRDVGRFARGRAERQERHVGKLLRDDTLYTHLVNMAVAGDSLMKLLSSGQGLAGRLLNDPTLYDQAQQADDRSRRDPRRRSQGPAPVFARDDLRSAM